MGHVARTQLGRRGLPRSAAALLIGLLALAGCSDDSTGDPPASPSPSTPTGPATAAGNGALYLIDWADDRWQYERYPILEAGKLGSPPGPVELGGVESELIHLVDALGSTVATAPLTNYWSTRIDLRDASDGKVAATVDAPRWCGGEGLVYNPCLLLDGDSLVRTSELGAQAEGSVTVSSLRTGDTEAMWGPYEGLARMLAAWQPGEVIVILADELMDTEGDPMSSAGSIVRLNAMTGETTQIGRHVAGWSAICQIGPDSVLGYALEDPRTLSVVGSGSVPTVELSEADNPVGCSADGTELYVDQVILGEDENGDDTKVALDSISLADGTRTRQMTVPATGLIHVTR